MLLGAHTEGPWGGQGCSSPSRCFPLTPEPMISPLPRTPERWGRWCRGWRGAVAFLPRSACGQGTAPWISSRLCNASSKQNNLIVLHPRSRSRGSQVAEEPAAGSQKTAVPFPPAFPSRHHLPSSPARQTGWLNAAAREHGGADTSPLPRAVTPRNVPVTSVCWHELVLRDTGRRG